jgi:hypothetical protein
MADLPIILGVLGAIIIILFAIIGVISVAFAIWLSRVEEYDRD